MNANKSQFERRVKAAKDAIDDVFGDIRVSRAQTRDALEELVDHIRSMLETLSDD